VNLNSIDTREIRKFGIIALVFFGSLCVLGVWTKKAVPSCLFGFLSALGLGFILIPSPLRPVYAVWLKITGLIGKVITTLILTLAYYIVITPSGLLKRLFGGRPLPVKPDKNAESYWVTRDEPAQPRERFIKRF
jgi:hypothetical protein